MKTVAALIASVLLSVVTFTAGALGTMFYLSVPEPASMGTTSDVSHLWTTEPTIVTRDQRQFERVAARETPVTQARSERSSPETVEQAGIVSDRGVDELTTGSTVAAEKPQDQRMTALPREHVQWCRGRYNSFRIEDGTYQPYRGKRQPCISPYVAENVTPNEEGGAADEVLSSARRALGDTSMSMAEVAADLGDHVQKCSKRYRSYRPEDNTYQPFGGGPRQHCR